jgi:hypothetical protein
LNLVCFEFHSSRLPDEVQSQQDGRDSIAVFDPTLHPTKWSSSNPDETAPTDLRCQSNLNFFLKRLENVRKLARKGSLIEHIEQIRNVIAPERSLTLFGS